MPTPRTLQRIGRLQRVSRLLDEAFRIPGTRFRFGWDPLVGLVPGVGDAVPALFAFVVIVEAFRARLPFVVKVKMIINLLIDAVGGAVPVLGDVFDFFWKSHKRNLALLEKHGIGEHPPGLGDWIFVSAAALLVAAAVALPLIVVWLIATAIPGVPWPDAPSWGIL